MNPLHIEYMLTALITSLTSQKSVPWNNVNLDKCSPNVNYCHTKVTPYLIGCTASHQARCACQCPLG